MSDTMLFSITDHIATISFNRPAAMNSFDKQMGDELLVIFMAGGDIRFFHENMDVMPEGVMHIVRALNASILNLTQMAKPVIASVHGSVAGVGMSLMMACDLAIAAENTKFTMAYSGIGISPDGGAAYHLPRLVGTKKAMEWILMSDVFDASAALAHGLINWVVAPDQFAAETQRLATRMANGPTQSLASAKQLVNESWQLNLESHLEREGRAFERCTTTTDFREGVSGFLKKSKPQFVGE
jgi:2-(1,2-epoxy-1,2-dihydrophenyl)acetyl-CoA isomerase